MLHKFRKMVALILSVILLLINFPVLHTSAAYANGYAGGMAGDGGGIYAHGVDLSEWQGSKVDFQKIKAQGYSFVILRVGFATTIDDTFESNYIRAKEAGLDVGVYLYSYADNVLEALKEADACKTWLQGRQLEYPVYYDLEDPKTHGSMSKELLSQIAVAFLDEMAADGWLVGLYSCLSWLNYKIDTQSVCQQYECWMAQYLHSGSYDVYDRYDEVYGMWQYSSTGRVNGIDGNVDMNISFKDYPGICRQYGFNGYTRSDETLHLSGVSVPDALKTGSGFSVKGTVTSTKGILSNVTAGIYDQSGKAVMERSGSKGKNTYDLSLLANGIRPAELQQGKYYYRISASNSYETRILLNHLFWVSDSGVASENVNLPKDLRVGDSFAPEGILYGIGKIGEVRVTVEDGKGNSLAKAVAFPEKTSYDLSELQGAMTLSGLQAGEYYYRIYAAVSGSLQLVLSHSFTVWIKNDPIILSSYSLRTEYNPGELTDISGTATSEKSMIRRFEIVIKNTAGETVALVDEACNLKQILLSDYNDDLNLQLLPVGQYSCRITATNAAGPAILANTSFLIQEDLMSLCEFSAPGVLFQGDSFLVSGAAAGNVSPLEFVRISAYDEEGTCVLSAAAVPDSNVYDLSGLQDRLLFSSLSTGTYTLCVTAENARGIQQLYEAPFTVTDSLDRVFWKAGAFAPNGMTFSQSSPFALWGTLVSGVSELQRVRVEVLGDSEIPVTYAELTPESKEVDLEICNEMLRLAALAPGDYHLRITAENQEGSFVLMNSPFSISECLHGNVASGNAFFANCCSAGAICDSQCIDCGAKVRNGVLLPAAEHEYRGGLCGGCSRSEFKIVRAVKADEALKHNDRIVIAVRQGENWYALSMDGSSVPIAAPNSDGSIFVGADLLWTLSVHWQQYRLMNPFGKTLHLDSENLAICRGNQNAGLQLACDGDSWRIGLDDSSISRFLSYDGRNFGVSESGLELVFFRYCPENTKS